MRLNPTLKLPAITTTLILTLALILVPARAHAATGSPAVVTATCPTFPPIARAAHVNGEAVVDVKINSNGEVTSAVAVSGHPLLRKAAEAAAKRWRFVSVTELESSRTAQLTFVFSVMAKCSATDELTSVFYPPYKIEVKAQKPEVTCSDCSQAEQEKLRCKNQ